MILPPKNLLDIASHTQICEVKRLLCPREKDGRTETRSWVRGRVPAEEEATVPLKGLLSENSD